MKRYPTKCFLSHNFFASLHQKIAEIGSFQSRARVRIARTPAIEQNVLLQVQETPSTNTRSQAHAVRVSRFSVWRILQEHNMHLFHVQRFQVFQPNDYAPDIAFAQWYLESVLQIPFSLLKHNFPMRHPSQEVKFSTHIMPI